VATISVMTSGRRGSPFALLSAFGSDRGAGFRRVIFSEPQFDGYSAARAYGNQAAARIRRLL
jgi:hypothetical protein